MRASIVDAAEELIAARGLLGAGLAQIARRAGVAVGTLYNYFTDRDALIRGLFEARRASLRPLLVEAMASGRGQPFEPRLRAFVHDVLAAFETHRRFVKVAIENEHLKPSPSSTQQDLRAAIAEIVAAGVAERAIAPQHAALLPIMIGGAIRGVLQQRVTDGGAFADDAAPIVAILLDGAGAR